VKQHTSERAARGIVTLVVIAIVIAAAMIVPRFTSVEYSKVGQCLAAKGNDDYKRVGCDSADAKYKVTGVTDSSDACIDIPGTIATFTKGSKTLCIGDAARDPATTINGITAGECVMFKGQAPYKTACGTSGAAEVLLVLKNVSKDMTGSGKVVQACIDKGATKTDSAYAWGISRTDLASLSWDRVLCLGAEHS